MTAPGTGEPGGAGAASVAAWPPAWRWVAALLRVLSRGTLVGVVAMFFFSDQPPTNPLKQMRIFFGLVAAPELAAWCLARAFLATVRTRDGRVVLEQRDVRTEIPVTAISAVEPWVLPLPGPGLWVRLRSGRRFGHGLEVADADAFVEAVVAAGGEPALRDALSGPAAVYQRARRESAAWRIDHPLFRFVLYSLVPTVPAFRLHQIITYGGTFGEYHTFGVEAYLVGFGLWWVSWAFSLLLIATALRVVVEALCIVSAWTVPAWAGLSRRVLEHARRVLYFGGIPGFLILRFWPW